MKADDSAQNLKQNHMYPARQRQYQNALRQAHWKKMHTKWMRNYKYTKKMLIKIFFKRKCYLATF